jgi:alkanesulfonate monooxygenase SsuD/methylene tetrahydromethanopterin reductase-like flavin-dependent oxidoreductase (luciferase family)
VRFGVVILPEQRWAQARSTWQRVEALGFAHAWTYDHLAWRSLRDGPWFTAMPVLTAAATVTSGIRLGTLVASPNFRHPVTFAKEVLALDDVSSGRAVVGVGAGGTGWDSTVLGIDALTPTERAERFREFVEVLDLLLREPAASYHGAFYRAVEARTFPGPVQMPRPPLAIAGVGPRAMRLAARLGDYWVTTGPRENDTALDARTGAQVVAGQIERLAHACSDEGRDLGAIGRLVVLGPTLDAGTSSAATFRETAARYADIGVTDLVVHWPRPEPPYAGDVAEFERAVADVVGSGSHQ